MFYKPEDGHGLPHDPFKACVAPRPIGWISSVDAAGTINVAPYSFFNAVASAPPMVMYANNGKQPHGPKDTLTNIRDNGEFVVNVATWDLRDAMNVTSGAEKPEVDEMALAGLTPAPCTLIKPPRIAESPINMECRAVEIIDLPCDQEDGANVVVIGRVLGIHIDESILTDGLIDMAKLRPVARLGYKDYAVIEETFTMSRPGGADKLAGL